MRKLICITALAVVAVMAPAASAAMKTMSVVTLERPFLTNGASIWSGELASPKAICGDKRVVSVFVQRPGADRKLGAVRAKPAGGVTYSWTFKKKGYAVKTTEKYYAKVKPTAKCSGAHSPAWSAVESY